jgi:hypothetical protein
MNIRCVLKTWALISALFIGGFAALSLLILFTMVVAIQISKIVFGEINGDFCTLVWGVLTMIETSLVFAVLICNEKTKKKNGDL